VMKAPPRIDSVNVNDAVREVIDLTYGEVLKNRVSVRTQFAEGLPRVQGAGPLMDPKRTLVLIRDKKVRAQCGARTCLRFLAFR